MLKCACSCANYLEDRF